jgi:predicted transposase YbfD/YdcC
MSAIVTYTADAVVPAFPAAVELHWEIENRVVWNEHEHTNEERELGRSGRCKAVLLRAHSFAWR